MRRGSGSMEAQRQKQHQLQEDIFRLDVFGIDICNARG